MAKILTDHELLDIVRRIVEEEDLINDSDSYNKFLADLSVLLSQYLGATVGNISPPFEGAHHEWLIAFHANECTPLDGRAFAKYDTDVSVEQWIKEGLHNV